MLLLNIALIPDQETQQKLQMYSKEIAAHLPSKYVLGKNSIVHCTLLHFSYDGEPKEAWDKVKRLQTRVELEPARMSVIPGRTGTWFQINLKRTPELIRLQEDILQALGLTIEQVHNQKDGKFLTPHFTTGMVEGKAEMPEITPPKLKEKIQCTLHLGLSGEHWVLQKILF